MVCPGGISYVLLYSYGGDVYSTMTKKKHPHSRAERLQIKAELDEKKIQEGTSSHLRRKFREIVKDQETYDELQGIRSGIGDIRQ